MFLTKSMAQDSGLSFELHYPLDFEKTTNQYTDVQGIFGGALQYRLTDNDKLNYGIAYKFDLIQANKILPYSPTKKFNFLVNHINLFGKLNLDNSNLLQLQVTGGLSVYNYNKSSNNSGYTGFNAGVGLSYNLVERVYFHTNFSYIKAFLKQKQTGFVDTESRQIIRFGVGFRI